MSDLWSLDYATMQPEQKQQVWILKHSQKYFNTFL